jgi:flagellar biosynthesis protein FlhF
MESFVEQGLDRRDCLSRIVAKYGERVAILRERKIRFGGFMGLFTKEGVELEFYIPPMLNRGSWQYQTGEPLSFEEAKKKVLAAAGKDPEQAAAQVTAEAAAQEAAQIAAQAEKESSQRQILDTLQEIKEKIGVKQDDHPGLVRLAELLKLNDFSDSYVNTMLERARKEVPLDTLDDFDALQDRALEWIGESISIYREPEAAPRKSRIMVLVGPTGVGKTTTIAKLAAIFGIENSGKSALAVRMITIDAFRIGAKAQLESYGNIMGIPVSYIDSRQDLKKEIALYSDVTDLFLVDTIGKSPRDSAKLGEMKELLDVFGSRAEIHLVLSASTKTSDIAEILRQFEPFKYRSVLLTKLDETSHAGNVISALAERGKSVSYITDGQKVPNDIKRASVVRFLINLDEFKINREKIEKRFPVDEADQFQWSK